MASGVGTDRVVSGMGGMGDMGDAGACIGATRSLVCGVGGIGGAGTKVWASDASGSRFGRRRCSSIERAACGMHLRHRFSIERAALLQRRRERLAVQADGRSARLAEYTHLRHQCDVGTDRVVGGMGGMADMGARADTMPCLVGGVSGTGDADTAADGIDASDIGQHFG